MADTSNGNKKLSMELRLLLAFILMGVVLFTTPYFYKSTPPPAQKSPAAAPAKQAPPPQPAPARAPAPKTQPVKLPASAAQSEQTFTVDTELYRVALSNRGAVVRSWQLKKYQHNGKPLELVNTVSHVDRPLALVFRNQKPAVDVNQALYVPKPDPDGLGIAYEFSDGNVAVRKTFRFQRSSYLSQVSTEVLDSGRPVPHLLAWRGGFGDLSVPNAAGNTQALHFDVSESKLVKSAAKVAKDGPVSSSGNYSFAGLEDTYFAAAFLTQTGAGVETMTFSDTVPTPADQNAQPFVGTAVGGSGGNRFALFVGPKDIDILRNVNPRLEQLVDFGWFAFLAKPLFLAVHWTAERLIHNYGWAIILVTVVINFILFPLKVSSMRSMKKMQALQPQIAAINEKYKGLSMRDPRKQEQNAEVMGLYKKHGINPAGGCVPMLLQIPFFIAFYKVISVSIEMRGASWLWVSDLSQPEHLAIRILPIAMIISQFIMQKMTPSTSVDPAQQRMMLLMPLVFGFMFYGLSSGLVLYYFTSNLVGIAQQWFFNRTATVKDLPQPVPARKRNRK